LNAPTTTRPSIDHCAMQSERWVDPPLTIVPDVVHSSTVASISVP
jgi:hypothetical protein